MSRQLASSLEGLCERGLFDSNGDCVFDVSGLIVPAFVVAGIAVGVMMAVRSYLSNRNK